MTIQKAIEKAIEGGFKHDYDCECKLPSICSWHEDETENAIFLKPTFWQSLGKEVEWINIGNTLKEREEYIKSAYRIVKEKTIYHDWLFYQHALIDYLAEGKTIESYFETL